MPVAAEKAHAVSVMYFDQWIVKYIWRRNVDQNQTTNPSLDILRMLAQLKI